MTEIVSVERDGAGAAREALERCVGGGGIAVFPSDGVYGLACDPLDEAAIARTKALKGREQGRPSAVLYFSLEAMRELIGGLPAATRGALSTLLPGPVTLIVANPERRYPLANPDDPERLGIRLIEGPLAGARCPVLQTSANRSGEPPPARLADVPEQIVAGADVAIDGGELGGEPSTVIDLTAIEAGGAWEVLREGALRRAEVVEALTGLDLG